MHKSKFLLIVSWSAVLLWMALIFYSSAQGGTQSGSLSLKITEFIVKIIKKAVPELNVSMDIFHLLFRKASHFFVYFVLGMLVLNGFLSSGVQRREAFIITCAICFLYAVGDEVHQLYVPGRSGQITDVLIDSAGAFAGSGMLMIWIAHKQWNK